MKVLTLTLTLTLTLAAAPIAAAANPTSRGSQLELCRQAIVLYEPIAKPQERTRFRALERKVAAIQEAEEQPRVLDVQEEQTMRSFRGTLPIHRGMLVGMFCSSYEKEDHPNGKSF